MATPTPPDKTKGTTKAAADTTKGADAGSTEKKARGPRKDYGFKPGATITIDAEKADAAKFRGKRLEYFERLQKADGKTVEEFFALCPEGDPPRGWLRFFVAEAGVASLSGGKDPEPKAKAKAKAEDKDKEAA